MESKKVLDILASVHRITNDEHSGSAFFDLNIQCKDGTVRWSKILLVSNSLFLQRTLLLDTSDEDIVSIILPDVTASTLSSMLKCTVNPDVRRDTLSVNELEVMKILRFELLENHLTKSIVEETFVDHSLEIQDVAQLSIENGGAFDEAGSEVILFSPSESSTTEAQLVDSRAHLSDGLFRCRTAGCQMSFTRQLHLERHEASHSTKDPKVCEVCGKIFYHDDNLKLHLRYHEDLKQVISCSHCSRSFCGQRALKLHIESSHMSKVTCQFCEKSMTKRLLKRHMNRKHKDEITDSDTYYQCHLCDREFSTAQALSVHRRSHEGINGFLDPMSNQKDKKVTSVNQQDLQCNICKKSFRTLNHLSAHHRRSHQRDIVECEKCGEKVKDMKQHDRNVHKRVEQTIKEALASTFNSVDIIDSSKNVKRASKPTEDGQVPCKVCGKTYRNKHGLARHLREVHAENRHECPLCGHFFPVRHSLSRHIRNVHQPVKHDCPYCGIQVIHLAVHIHSAHGLDPANAKTVAESQTGKSAARTDLTLECVLQRRRHQQELLLDARSNS